MKKIALIGMIFTLFSCTNTAKNEFTYWVNSYKVSCEGVGKMTCLLIQKSETPEPGKWVNFYSAIEGFNYEPGYIYQLKVKEEALENIPADAPAKKYTLVKEISKTHDSKININDIWLVTAINHEEIVTGQEHRKDAVIEINLSEIRISGTDGCNRFNGSITVFDDGVIEFGPIAATRMMCMDMTTADKMNTALPLVRKFKIENSVLTLSDESGNELLSCKKVD